MAARHCRRVAVSASAVVRQAPLALCRPIDRHVLEPANWAAMAARLASEPTLELLGFWADPRQVHALLHDRAAPELRIASTDPIDGRYAALSPSRPAAAWFERMVHDLWGHVAEGGTDLRPWLDHGHPQRRTGSAEPPEFLPPPDPDERMHQIPLGPVQAGFAEPHHVRLFAEGEAVRQVEVRLGYAHKGTLALMRGKTPRAAARFAARLSGDSTVAHSIAFARATEAACGTDAPPRAQMLRGVMAELERLANHLGDIGSIAGHAGFALLPVRLGWHREQMLRAAEAAFGHRLMMDVVVPGGVSMDIMPPGGSAILAALDGVEHELPGLLALAETSASLTDRLVGSGVIASDLAASHAAGGVVGRASGRGFDLRSWPGYPPYEAMTVPVDDAGDVAARVRLRGAEAGESVRLLRTWLAALPEGPLTVPLPMAGGEGVGWAESFRGEVFVWLRLDGGLIGACFARDPSWLHWPLLQHAAVGESALADFSLVGGSINASCSGVDL
jgi:Ni,Fe-hydrogenase III large subunit